MQSSIAEFQKYHRLKTRNGSLDAETYKQIGNELTDAQVSIISLHSPGLKQLLYGINPSPDWGEERFFIIGFSDDEYSLINEQVKFMGNTPACSKAFEDAGLTSAKTMVSDYKLIFVHNKLLGTMANNAKWSGTEPLRIGIRDQWGATPYAGDVTLVGSNEGKYYVCLQGSSFNNSIDTPQRVITHALIHAGGAKGNSEEIAEYINFPADRAGTATTPAGVGVIHRRPIHDLEWMNYRENKTNQYTGAYDAIMEKSTKK